MKKVEAVARDSNSYGEVHLADAIPTLTSTFMDGQSVVIVDARELAELESMAYAEGYARARYKAEREAGRVEAQEAIVAMLRTLDEQRKQTARAIAVEIMADPQRWRAFLPSSEDGGKTGET